jgi:alpha-tubulin suppressor-like RCC1 family protein
VETTVRVLVEGGEFGKERVVKLVVGVRDVLSLENWTKVWDWGARDTGLLQPKHILHVQKTMKFQLFCVQPDANLKG